MLKQTLPIPDYNYDFQKSDTIIELPPHVKLEIILFEEVIIVLNVTADNYTSAYSP